MNARLFVLIAITLAGCDQHSVGPLLDMSVPKLSVCSSRCDEVCSPGTKCVAGDDFNATCLQACVDSRGCSAGAQCAELKGANVPGRWCIDARTPTHCGIGCAVGSPQRCEGDIAVHGYAQGEYCATVYEYCPRGCEVPDGGLAARCNP